MNKNLSTSERGESLFNFISKKYRAIAPDSVIYYANILYDFSKTHNYKKGEYQALNLLAISYAMQKDYDKSIEFFSENLDLSIKENNLEFTAKTYYNLGKCYLSLNQFYKAYENNHNSLKAYKSLLNTVSEEDRPKIEKNIFLIYNAQLVLLLDLNELEKARNLKQELEVFLSQKQNESENFFKLYHNEYHLFLNFAEIEYRSEEYEQAKKVLLTKFLNKQVQEKILLADAFSKTGQIYLKLNDIDSAAIYFNKSLELYKNGDSQKGIAQVYINLARLNASINNNKKVKEYLSLATPIALENNLIEELSNIYEIQSDYYLKKKNFLKSNQFLVQHLELKDSIQNEKNKTLLLSLEDKYRYESELNEQKHNLKLENQRLKNTRLILYVITIFSIIILSFTYILFSLNRKLKKQQLTLEQQQKELKFINKKIHAKNESLRESNQKLENFAFVAAHDIQAPIRTISSISKILYQNYGDVFNKESKEYFEFIIKDSKRLSELVNSLLAFSKLTSDLPTQKPINLNELINVIFTELEYNINEEGIQLDKDIAPQPTIVSYYPLISQLFLNLISNSIKFSKPNLKNKISLSWQEKENSFLEFTYRDEGIGIPEKVMPHIFDMFSKHYRNNNNIGSGIGLSTCKKIVTFLGGEINVQSEVDVGTEFVFTLKINSISNNVYYVHAQ